MTEVKNENLESQDPSEAASQVTETKAEVEAEAPVAAEATPEVAVVAEQEEFDWDTCFPDRFLVKNITNT